MKIKELFLKPVERPIDGVIKADDQRNLLIELEEYVVTRDVAKGLSNFTDRYLNELSANGVWISGFFGSSKSHLLKILSLVLDGQTLANGVKPADILLPKIEDEIVHDLVPEGDEVSVHLVTQSDPETCIKQSEHLTQIATSFTGSRVVFTWALDANTNFHARSIVTDTGWKITIDRGLDIFQRFESGPFSVEQAIQEARLTRGAEVSYLKV